MSGLKIHMLHGAIGKNTDWLKAQEYLEHKGFLTNAYDLYCYLSEHPCSFGGFTKAFIKDVTRNQQNEKKHNLLGYSLGGRLALHAMLARPSMWGKAVIVSAHTGIAQQEVRGREERVKSDLAWADLAGDTAILWTDFLAKWNQQSVLTSNQTLNWSDRGALEPVRRQVANSFRGWSLGLQEDLLEKISELTMPILWVVGEDDLKFLEIARKATDVLPNGKLHIVKNAGHRVPWQQSKIFHSLISEWFKDSS